VVIACNFSQLLFSPLSCRYHVHSPKQPHASALLITQNLSQLSFCLINYPSLSVFRSMQHLLRTCLKRLYQLLRNLRRKLSCQSIIQRIRKVIFNIQRHHRPTLHRLPLWRQLPRSLQLLKYRMFRSLRLQST
jgi:hypothetical protein